MSRVTVGWIPTPGYKSEDDHHGLSSRLQRDGDIMTDELPDNLTWEYYSHSICHDDRVGAPLPAQQVVEDEATSWDGQWGANVSMPPCQWPVDLGELPSQLNLYDLKVALLSFPPGLGLGWDNIHPEALLRLGDNVLQALLRLLFLCE